MIPGLAVVLCLCDSLSLFASFSLLSLLPHSTNMSKAHEPSLLSIVCEVSSTLSIRCLFPLQHYCIGMEWNIPSTWHLHHRLPKSVCSLNTSFILLIVSNVTSSRLSFIHHVMVIQYILLWVPNPSDIMSKGRSELY